MKVTKKQAVIAASLLLITAGVAGYFTYQHFSKRAYDYTDYYVPAVRTEDPKTEPEQEPEEEVEEKELSLDLLKQTNADIVGIIEFDDRMIYEPVVQAPDNDYYVRRNIEQSYSGAGIPFVSGDGNIYSTNVVIYGHSSTMRSIIFTPLMSYVDASFYRDHPTFHFITEDGTRTYQIFAVLNIDTKDVSDTLEFASSEWRKTSSYEAFLQDMQARSLYSTGVQVSGSDKIMTLVTCDTRNGNKRIVVLGKEISLE